MRAPQQLSAEFAVPGGMRQCDQRIFAINPRRKGDGVVRAPCSVRCHSEKLDTCPPLFLYLFRRIRNAASPISFCSRHSSEGWNPDSTCRAKHSNVIPAKAGIQFNMSCEALKSGFVSFGRVLKLDSSLRWNDGVAGRTTARAASPALGQVKILCDIQHAAHTGAYTYVSRSRQQFRNFCGTLRNVGCADGLPESRTRRKM